MFQRTYATGVLKLKSVYGKPTIKISRKLCSKCYRYLEEKITTYAHQTVFPSGHYEDLEDAEKSTTSEILPCKCLKAKPKQD
jgi:hypothetical protein